jgi:hypothetical protein
LFLFSLHLVYVLFAFSLSMINKMQTKCYINVSQRAGNEGGWRGDWAKDRMGRGAWGEKENAPLARGGNGAMVG